MVDILLDALLDSLRLLPFLFVTYLVMGILERAASARTKDMIKKAGKFGPVWGSLLGAFPQCGFSAAASYFYMGRVLTLGTLMAIYMSTSDEMLPILISQKVEDVYKRQTYCFMVLSPLDYNTVLWFLLYCKKTLHTIFELCAIQFSCL